MSYKLSDKQFLDSAIISNVHAKLLKGRFSEGKNQEELVDESVELAVLMLEKRNVLLGESVKKTPSKKVFPDIDFEQIVEIYNSVCLDCKQVTKITKSRENAIIKILESYSLEQIGQVFTKVQQSDYLSGRTTKSTWTANFDWIFSPSNFIKILEDNYKNKENGNNNSQGRTDFDIKQSANNIIDSMFVGEQ